MACLQVSAAQPSCRAGKQEHGIRASGALNPACDEHCRKGLQQEHMGTQTLLSVLITNHHNLLRQSMQKPWCTTLCVGISWHVNCSHYVTVMAADYAWQSLNADPLSYQAGRQLKSPSLACVQPLHKNTNLWEAKKGKGHL